MTPTGYSPLAQLVTAFAAALHQCGAPSQVVERHVDTLLAAYGVEGTALASPTAVWLQIGHQARVLRVQAGDVDLARLADLFRWHDALVQAPPPAEQALRELDALLARPGPWSTRAQALAFVLGSATGGTLFGGSLADTAFAALGGTLVWLGLRALAAPTWAPVRPLILALGAGAFGAVADLFGAGPLAVALASVLALLPGLGLTLAIQEVAEGQLQSGAARMLGAVVTAVQIATGVALGSSLGLLLPAGFSAPELPAATLAALAMGPVAVAVVLRVRPSDLPYVVAVAVAGFALTAGIGGAAGAGAGALAVGLAANALARIRRIPSLVTTLPGVFLLVPGAMGVRGVRLLLDEDLLGGAQTALQAFGVAGALAGGLLLAHALLPANPALPGPEGDRAYRLDSNTRRIRGDSRVSSS